MTTSTQPFNVTAPRTLPAALEALNALGVNRALSIIGRLAIVYLFCGAANFHLTFGWTMTINNMTAKGIPFPEVLNVVAMVISAGLSLALLFNVKARWAALGLALYVLCVSSIMYGPLTADWQKTRVLFMKDMAIFGALLAWSCTLADEWRHRIKS